MHINVLSTLPEKHSINISYYSFQSQGRIKARGRGEGGVP